MAGSAWRTNPAMLCPLILLLFLTSTSPAQNPGPWTALFPQGSLDAWERVGDGLWHALSDHTIVGQRDRRAARHQAWLYTKKEYRGFDLRFDYWLRHGQNSGVSIRDTSRARWAHGDQRDRDRTPSHIGYEIQILSAPSEKYPTGSLYLFQSARSGHERFHDWNTMEIHSRDHMIRVLLNGHLIMEHPGDPARSKSGPIGFQLHDAETVILLKNVEIREIPVN